MEDALKFKNLSSTTPFVESLMGYTGTVCEVSSVFAG